MTDAKKKQPVAFLGTDFNNFLFASIGIDRTGGQLSVVSALGRLDMDPWEAAEKLSRLPGESATQELITWMSRFPELVSGFEDRTTTAKRLVALLPRRVLGQTRIARTGVVDNNASTPRTIAALFLIMLGLMLAGQIILNVRSPVPQPLSRVDSPAAVSVPIAPNPGA
jgi:hypothetical protein